MDAICIPLRPRGTLEKERRRWHNGPGGRTRIEIIPAIDLRGGRCVRLFQGDFNQETVFSTDPVGVALGWQRQGAPRLHVVDLDGAAIGGLQNLEVAVAIASAVGIPVQLGGGIRSLEDVGRVLSTGIGRVVLGTAAVEDSNLVKEACRRFGEAVVIAVDAREGLVATRGWVRGSSVAAIELARRMQGLGVRRIIYTDISRDGTLEGPNFKAIGEMATVWGLSLIASGGISSIEHLRDLKALGIEGAIVGRALYTGDILLSEALTSVKGMRRGENAQ